MPGQRQKKEEPPVDSGIAELEILGATIARTVEAKNWPAVINWEPAEFREQHTRDLLDAKSDFYCFLVDAGCNENWKGRISVYHIMALAHSLGVKAIASGPAPAQAATLFFYDRSEIPFTALRSQDFLCKEGGWKKVSFWSFRRENGKWVAISPAFEYATDSFCN
jgi:hypothetical protein